MDNAVGCEYYDPLIEKKDDGSKVPCSAGVMPDGHYWINDNQRYGWEVVRILGGNLWRFGIKEACNLDKNKFEFIKLEGPTKA